MTLEATLIDQLLSSNITGSKEDGRGYALGEVWSSCQPGVVPRDVVSARATVTDRG